MTNETPTDFQIGQIVRCTNVLMPWRDTLFRITDFEPHVGYTVEFVKESGRTLFFYAEELEVVEAQEEAQEKKP